MKIRRAVFMVVYSKSKNKIKYLILKRKLHWKGWEFPKGGVRFFEPRILAVKRELREETGLLPLKINSFKEKGVYKYKGSCPDRKGIMGQNYKLYSAEVKFSRRIKIDKIEHSEYRWVDFKEALKKLTWKNQRKCLNIVNEFLKNEKKLN